MFTALFPSLQDGIERDVPFRANDLEASLGNMMRPHRKKSKANIGTGQELRHASADVSNILLLLLLFCSFFFSWTGLLCVALSVLKRTV